MADDGLLYNGAIIIFNKDLLTIRYSVIGDKIMNGSININGMIIITVNIIIKTNEYKLFLNNSFDAILVI